LGTVIDKIALELELDPRQFEAGLKSVVERVRVTRDDYERHAKSFEAVATSLWRAITPLIAAIIGIGSAIEAIDWSRHAAAATTEFTNLADVLDMNVEKLSAWKQAAEAAGKGGGQALMQSFARQQQTLLTALPGGTGLKDPEFLRALQRYGMADVSRYLDEKGNLDMDRFNRDIASASERIDKNNEERMQWQRRLYIEHPAQLSLYRSRQQLDDALKHQRDVVGVLNKENTDAMKQLHADWANLESAAENLRIQIVTNLAKPLHSALTELQEILTTLKGWVVPDWMKSMLFPHVAEEIKEKGWSWGDIATTIYKIPGLIPQLMMPRSPSGEPATPGGDVVKPSWPQIPSLPWPSSVTPAPAAPVAPAPAAPSGRRTIFDSNTGKMLSPTAPSSVPSIPGPSGALDLPQFASAMGRSNMIDAARPATNTNSNVTIGAISFNSAVSDSTLEHAPSGSDRTLSVGQYAVLANTSLL
jgi:hypothetical protein